MADFETQEDDDLYNYLIPAVDFAVSCGPFNPSQGALIYEARVRSWTKSSVCDEEDPTPFELDLSRLALKYRRDREELSRDFDALVKSRVFIPAEARGYLINEKPSTWLDAETGKPLLSGDRLEHVLAMEAGEDGDQE
ncbi:hypothetical protein [Singulisphaera sp. PoT]|uniref:hypothetical protein n=1 Tax=Singulisphaera sp. PoT TaxID=3411797 RepID=UPI003BF59B4B